MKNIAIVTSVIVIVVAGWLIIGMPHSSAPEPVVQPNTITTEESSDEVSTTPSAITPIKTTTTTKPQPSVTPVVSPTPATTSYTTAQVSAHATTQSCWSIIDGKVYDLTAWINQHPGGANAIKRLCGVDGTENFNDQHGGQSRPERELAAFFIGVLK